MATATPRPSRRPGSPGAPVAADPLPAAAPSAFLAACGVLYRFLASVKLAVICLGGLAATLAVATKFNSDYGMNAANEYIYHTTWFSVLMAFLGINVFCAAAIRYPWKKRQTGFVITHVGLLVVIAASWWSYRTYEEGLLGMVEGETSNELVRTHKPAVFVKTVDPHTGEAKDGYEYPLPLWAFDWGQADPMVISRPGDPFKLTIKDFYACSMPEDRVVPAEGGRPMLKLHPQIIPPGEKAPRDVFGPEQDPWFTLGDDRLGRIVRAVGPAQFIVARADRADIFDDFLDPPADPGIDGVARLHYQDRAGQPRRYDVRVDTAKADRPIPLPDSDLVATFRGLERTPIETKQQVEFLGTDTLDIVRFDVRRGDGPEVAHNGFAMLPNIPPIIPKQDDPAATPPTPLLRINYYSPPIVDPQANRRFGVIEVMVDRSGRLAYRVFQRGNPGVLRSHGPLMVGETITAFGGNNLAPMTLRFDVEQYLKSGRKEEIARSIDLPPNERDDALPAILAEISANGVSREVWLRRSRNTFAMDYKTVALGDRVFELAFDVDRLKLDFSLTLNDFDVGFDPGTQNPASFKSEVTLVDEKAKQREQKRTISMNNVLDYHDWRFFQTRYEPVLDKQTGRKTGEFISVFQVAKNPARNAIYLGCGIVILGSFVQFYMRAGVFSDGGKLEQQRAASKALKRLEAKQRAAGAAPTRTTPPSPKPRAVPRPDDDFEPL